MNLNGKINKNKILKDENNNSSQLKKVGWISKIENDNGKCYWIL